MAPAADAVHFFREVDDLEPSREGAHEIARRVRRTALDASRKLNPRLRVAIAAADGAHTILLHEVKECSATLLSQDLPHQCAKRVHVLAQRGVLRRKKDLATIHDEPLILARALLRGADG